jgi:hypothetical protein
MAMVQGGGAPQLALAGAVPSGTAPAPSAQAASSSDAAAQVNVPTVRLLIATEPPKTVSADDAKKAKIAELEKALKEAEDALAADNDNKDKKKVRDDAKAALDAAKKA